MTVMNMGMSMDMKRRGALNFEIITVRVNLIMVARVEMTLNLIVVAPVKMPMNMTLNLIMTARVTMTKILYFLIIIFLLKCEDSFRSKNVQNYVIFVVISK